MKKKFLLTLLAGLLGMGLLAGGCSSAGGAFNGDKSAGQSLSAGAENGAYDYEMADEAMPAEATMSAANNADVKMELPQDMGESGGGMLSGNAADTIQGENEKLIFTYNYSVETKDFDSFYKKICEKITQIGGYIESSETSGSVSDGANRYANIVLRVPGDKMEQMLSLLDSDSNITYQSSSSENVTLQYVDMQSHLKALRTEQETLLKLMEKADKLKDVIALQSQLTEIRYEIESYESQLRMYDNRVHYSTLYLNITEVQRTTNLTSAKASFWEETGNRLSDNMYAVGQWLREVAIWLISSLPVLVPLAAVAFMAVFWVRKRRKLGKRRNEDSENPETEKQDTDIQGTDMQD